MPTEHLDTRFSDPAAKATTWVDAEQELSRAELYWITTVRADGRPHVTPLVGVWHDGAAHFTTGPEEQKARNLEHHQQVALTTGTNTWAAGMDLVVEGTASRVTDAAQLQAVSDAYVAKYGEVWRFDVVDGGFHGDDNFALVFRVDPAKVLAFAKEPHGHTSIRF